MLDEQQQIIYVGKARNLRRRVSSYFQRSETSRRKRNLVERIRDIQVTVTHTEGEALLLENNLIKEFQPRYNVLLRDDKSYPYIFLSGDETYPRLSFHRGAKRAKGRYFGPYPSSGAVRDTLNLLQKLFKVRQCEDAFFRNRTRPCLQHQIKRCTAPCVNLISPGEYDEDTRRTVLVLEGRNNELLDELGQQMDQAAADLHYEEAAQLRDQIAALRRVQERQYVSNEGGDLDVVAVAQEGESACVQVFFIRAGCNLGNKHFFPKIAAGIESDEILAAFLSQYYLKHEIPAEVLIHPAVEEAEVIEQVLSDKRGSRVRISAQVRGVRARWVDMAQRNAQHALQARMASRSGIHRRLEALQEAFGLDEVPQRMECFDISHTMGEATVASCVVFNTEGAHKSDYRRFNIKNITAGDDYAAMYQALSRRYARLKEEEGKMPDILFIDGGKGQVSQAAAVLEELQIDQITLVGVAKGPERRAGEETLFLYGRDEPFILPADSAALHLIQQIRDEAHRFAITGHRQQRGKRRRTSVLEDIPGVGSKRRQQLLKHFGGLQEVSRAGIEDLARVPGISRKLAQQIYDIFHPQD